MAKVSEYSLTYDIDTICHTAEKWVDYLRLAKDNGLLPDVISESIDDHKRMLSECISRVKRYTEGDDYV